MSEINKKYLGQKNKITGNMLSLNIDNGNNEEVFVCGKCGEKQNIFRTKNTGFIEELDFICLKCGERNTISSY